MNVQKLIIAALTATVLPTSLNAQQTFNEMMYSKEKTMFILNAPTAQKSSVTLRLYKQGQGGKTYKTLKMKKLGDERWEATVKGDLKGKFYTFDIGKGETPGTFAKAVGVNGNRGAIVDLYDTDPSGWDKDVRPALKSPADLVVYELHVRDFSISPTSGLKYKGKYLALTEPKAIEYLKNLGINAIHFQPVFDFASIDETRLDKPQFNWGYDPKNYNVPEGSYATDPYSPATRIKEFKEMVMALHKAGIRVIFDAVYNHTFDIKGSNFQRTYPDYYYRKTKDGKRQFMLESVKYWIDEYHIDGFRFDLMGVHDIETMQAIREMVNRIDPSIYIYGEGWSAGSCAYPTGKLAVKVNTQQLKGIGAFSDDMRDALRGPFSDDHKGALLAGLTGQEESLKFGIVGGIAHPQVDMTKVNYDKKPWTNNPTEQISYVSCHDDMCLVDRLKASIASLTDKNIPEAIRTAELLRIDKLAQTCVFTSQGVPFILAGEEMLRDKKGVHNSYNSPDSINQFTWTNLQKYPQAFAYYKSLIQLRKNHPAFRLSTGDKVRQHLKFLPVQETCLVGFQLKNLEGIDAWKNIIVIYNFNKEAKKMQIPEGNYTVACCNGIINEEGLGFVSGKEVEVAPQSALILYQK